MNYSELKSDVYTCYQPTAWLFYEAVVMIACVEEVVGPDNITKADDGKFIIRLLTEKDDDAISYPLAQRAVEIYKKYSTHIYDGGHLFPILSNQKYNEHLKELGKAAGLTGEWIDYEYRLQEKIEVHTPKCDLATHTARRTFIVTALNEGVSTNLIMLITSHSDYKAMRPYIKATMKGTGSVIRPHTHLRSFFCHNKCIGRTNQQPDRVLSLQMQGGRPGGDGPDNAEQCRCRDLQVERNSGLEQHMAQDQCYQLAKLGTLSRHRPHSLRA